MRLFGYLLALFAAFGACTPEAIEVDPAGAAGDDTSSGATASTGATSSNGGESSAEAGMSSTLPAGGEPDSGGGTAEGGKAGSGGGGSGGGGDASNCASLSAPKPACTTCIPAMCPTQAKACEGTSCTCGDYGGYQGQMNCLLACPTLSPMMNAATDCASKCGFDNLGPLDSPLHQLFDCLVNPPKGPPLCGECFPVH